MNDRCGYPLYWHNCYKDNYDLIAPESYAHPAKMAPALCFKILAHLEELGLLKESDTILDPMGGTGLTAICAGAHDYKAITVELEDKFVGFQHQNKQYAESKLFKPLDWRIIQGDSRKLSELLKVNGVKTVMSPPYFQAGGEPKDSTISIRGRDYARNRYGDLSPGQIGNLKDSPLKAITSPPYAEAQSGGGISKLMRGEGNYNLTTKLPGSVYQPSEHGTTLGNIGNLPDKPLKAVMSPPYGEADISQTHMTTKARLDPNNPNWRPSWVKKFAEGYGESRRPYSDNNNNNIGNINAESYLSAMQTVYKEIAKVSDVLVVVTKNPTRNKQLRRLDLDTIRILEESGWSIHCQHRALLFEELEQADMFNGNQKKIKGRMSFFKRLSWQNGQPVAAWEDIIFATIP